MKPLRRPREVQQACDTGKGRLGAAGYVHEWVNA